MSHNLLYNSIIQHSIYINENIKICDVFFIIGFNKIICIVKFLSIFL